MRVQALAEVLHVTPQAIVTTAWLELGLRKNEDSNLSTQEAVRLREILVKARYASRPQFQGSPGTQIVDKSREISAICERHRIDTTPSPPPLPRPKLPTGWIEHLAPLALKHLDLPSKVIHVRLRPRREALIYWPAAYIEGNEFYFLGETVPVNLRNMSRPYNFIMQEVRGQIRPIILRRHVGRPSDEYSYLYTKIGICGLLNQPPSAWNPCKELQMPRGAMHSTSAGRK